MHESSWIKLYRALYLRLASDYLILTFSNNKNLTRVIEFLGFHSHLPENKAVEQLLDCPVGERQSVDPLSRHVGGSCPRLLLHGIFFSSSNCYKLIGTNRTIFFYWCLPASTSFASGC